MRISSESVLSAPWWPDLLQVKDAHTWDYLSHRFGVPSDTLRKALELAGQAKKPMAPGRKPKGYRAPTLPPEPATTGHPLDSIRGRLGKMPDGELAALAGLTVDEVKAYRREQGIAPFLRAPPGAVPTASTPEPSPALRQETVALRRRKSAEGESTAVVSRLAPAPVPSAAPSDPLDAFRDQMGTVGDHVIAERAGVDRGLVGRYRRQHGIAAWEGFRFRGGEARAPRASELDRHAHLFGVHGDRDIADLAAVPVARVRAYRKRRGIAEVVPERATAPARTKRTSVIATYLDQLGTVPDSEVAAKAGVAVGTVTEYRRRHGIAGFVPPDQAHLQLSDAPQRRPRASKLDAYADRVGVLPDAEVATLAGVTAEGVRMYRRRHGIVAARPPVDVPVEAVPTAQATLHGFGVVALNATEHRFVIVGSDITDALRRTVAALDARSDGPWVVKSIRMIAEALS